MTNNLDLIYIQFALDGFTDILCDISAFSSIVANENATFGDQVTVPYISHNSASNAFSYTTGYQSDQTSIVGRDVTLNNLLYRVCNVNDNAAGKLSGDALIKTFSGMGQALARDVISASFASVLTEANFNASASITQTNLTSSIGLSQLVKQSDDLKWTENRSLILTPEAFQYVLQNPDVNKSYAYGASDPIQSGKVNSLFGFSTHKYGGALPTLAQPAKGIAVDNSAILFGFGTHKASAEGSTLVKQSSAVNKGVVLTLKTYYSPDYATTRYVVECVFGTGVGNSTGLTWIKA